MITILCPTSKLNKGRETECTLKKIPYKQTNKLPKESHVHTAHYPKVRYKFNNILQQFLYNNALQIPRYFEVTLLHHSDYIIYLTKPQIHWKAVLNETLS